MIRLFATHPTAANIMMLALMILGLAALPTLQRDTFPIIPPSEVEVRIAYPGASPEEVERAICIPQEDPVRAVDNLDEMSCLARDNQALLSAEIVEGADMRRFFDDVKAAVEGVDGLPEETEKPVSRIVERIANVATVAITGPDGPHALLAYADRFAEDLTAHSIITQATVSGFSDREFAVELSASALQRHGLTISDVGEALERASLDMPAGTLEGRQGDAVIRFRGERTSVEELATVPLTNAAGGAEVRLGDVAKISLRFADPWNASYFAGKRAALVTVTKTESQDTLRIMAALQERLAVARAEAPGNIRLDISQDTSSNIRDRLRIIVDNGLQGLVLVLVTMWLFFGLRVSFWVSMGLPVSFLGAIFAMQVFGLTLNMMTMVALLVAIGLLMDDAIVISENIVRRRRAGEGPVDAAVNGAKQVLPGVIASFLTTAMIVGPLGYLSGNIGAVLKYIPITLMIVLLISLAEAFLILPNHLSHSLRADGLDRVGRAVNRGFERFRDGIIVPLCGLALRWRYLTLGLAICLLLVSIAPFTGKLIKFQSFPQLESDTVEARLLLVQGSPFSRTQERVRQAVTALEKLDAKLTPAQPGGQPLVQSYTVSYGVNSDTPETGAHMATVSAQLLPAGIRATEVTDVLAAWKKGTGPMADMAALRFTDKERGVGGKAIDIRVQGRNLADLEATAREMRRFFLDFEGVRDVTYDLKPGKPEYVITLRSVPAGALGISARDVARELRAAFRGDTNLELRDEQGVIDIVARLDGADRLTADDIGDLRLTGTDGALVPLSAVARITRSRGYASIRRTDGQRTVSVQGTINPAVANARELMSALKSDFLPELAARRPDVSVVIVGEAKDTATTGRSLARNLLIGLIGVYLILAFQFRSFIEPVAVLAVIPLGFVGVIWGHLALGLQLSLPSLVGLATLAGVVVNDSILLVAFIKDRIRDGAPLLEAARDAARDRFRAIFLTSLTTVAGLGPLLLEQSTQAQFLRPLVASLAFGLAGATFMALFVTPAIFAILHDLRLIRSAPKEPGESLRAVEESA